MTMIMMTAMRWAANLHEVGWPGAVAATDQDFDSLKDETTMIAHRAAQRCARKEEIIDAYIGIPSESTPAG